MGTPLANDIYGRSVMFSSDSVTDTYVIGTSPTDFSVSVVAGTPQETVYYTINAMAP